MSKQKNETKVITETVDGKKDNIFEMNTNREEQVSGKVPEPAENDKKVVELKLIQKDLIDELASIKEEELPELVEEIKRLEEKVKSLNEDYELDQLEEGVLGEAKVELEEQKGTLEFFREGIISKEGALVKLKKQIDERLRHVRSVRAEKLEQLIKETRGSSRIEITKGFDALNKLADLELQRMKEIVLSGQCTAFPVLDSFLEEKYPLLIELCKVVLDGLDVRKIETVMYKLAKEIGGAFRSIE